MNAAQSSHGVVRIVIASTVTAMNIGRIGGVF